MVGAPAASNRPEWSVRSRPLERCWSTTGLGLSDPLAIVIGMCYSSLSKPMPLARVQLGVNPSIGSTGL